MDVGGGNTFGEEGVSCSFSDAELDTFVEVPHMRTSVGVSIVMGFTVEAVLLEVGLSPLVYCPSLRTMLAPGTFTGLSGCLLWGRNRDDWGARTCGDGWG